MLTVKLCTKVQRNGEICTNMCEPRLCTTGTSCISVIIVEHHWLAQCEWACFLTKRRIGNETIQERGNKCGCCKKEKGKQRPCGPTNENFHVHITSDSEGGIKWRRMEGGKRRCTRKGRTVCGRRDRKENEGEGLLLANKQTHVQKHAHIHTHNLHPAYHQILLDQPQLL